MKVACLGPVGTFSEEAALSHWPPAEIVRCATTEDVFRSVERGLCERGLVPFHNSTSGSSGLTITRVLAKLAEGKVLAVEVVIHPVVWCAVSRKPLEETEILFSHEEGLRQCRPWMERSGARWKDKIERTPSTAAAAQAASENERGAALASRRAATYYKVPVRVSDLQEDPDNATFFYAIARDHHEHGNDCCTLVVSPSGREISQVAGPTVRVGDPAARVRRTLLVETAPELEFHELAGGLDDENVKEFLDLLRKERGAATVVGCHPAYPLTRMVGSRNTGT